MEHEVRKDVQLTWTAEERWSLSATRETLEHLVESQFGKLD